MSAGFICLILFIMLSFWSLVVLFDQCLYVVILASVLSFFFFVSSKPLELGIFFMLCTRKQQKTKLNVPW